MTLQSGKVVAAALCILLFAFMTAEASHSHRPSRTLQPSFCAWCSLAHTAVVPVVALPPEATKYTQELVVTQELNERSLLLVRLEPVRPPPFPQRKDSTQ